MAVQMMKKKVRLAIQSHLEIVKKQEIDKVLEMLDQNALNYMNVLWSVYTSEDVKRIKSYLEDTDYPVLEVEWIKKLYQEPKRIKNVEEFRVFIVKEYVMVERIKPKTYAYADQELITEDVAEVKFRSHLFENKYLTDYHKLLRDENGIWKIDLLFRLKHFERKSREVLKTVNNDVYSYVNKRMIDIEKNLLNIEQ